MGFEQSSGLLQARRLSLERKRKAVVRYAKCIWCRRLAALILRGHRAPSVENRLEGLSVVRHK